MNQLLKRLIAVSALLLGQSAFAAEPLVDVAWIKENAGKPNVVVLDVQTPADYQRAHIPGAVNTDFEKSGWREERADKVPDMLPAKLDKLVAHIGSLGIDNTSHVVLVPPGKNYADMGWATRIYWTFKIFGHDNISILDGGMAAYAKDKKNLLEAGVAAKPTARSFTVNFRETMRATVDEVKAAKGKGLTLVDNRPEDQYAGINRNPKASINGTLEGAMNLPTAWVTENAGGQFRNKAKLQQLYKLAGVPTSGEQINFCNTGHLASIGWFVSSELVGNKNAKLYDGSMVEWTLTKAGPIEQKVKLD